MCVCMLNFMYVYTPHLSIPFVFFSLILFFFFFFVYLFLSFFLSSSLSFLHIVCLHLLVFSSFALPLCFLFSLFLRFFLSMPFPLSLFNLFSSTLLPPPLPVLSSFIIYYLPILPFSPLLLLCYIISHFPPSSSCPLTFPLLLFTSLLLLTLLVLFYFLPFFTFFLYFQSHKFILSPYFLLSNRSPPILSTLSLSSYPPLQALRVSLLKVVFPCEWASCQPSQWANKRVVYARGSSDAHTHN